jgi:tetratricopeptide (TPR) repeat protein
MQLAAAILAGGNRESAIGGAIESANAFVDHFVLIDTGPSAQKAIEVASSMLGDRCSIAKYPGDFDCATARNFALKSVFDAGFDWALMLDTDERIQTKPGIVRRMLDEITTNTVLIEDERRVYKKTKLFHKSHQGQWSGIVHEAYCSLEQKALAKGITFSELPKTAEEMLARNIWIEDKCLKAIELEPGQARWHFYHADALQSLGSFDEAVEEYLEASELSTWDEEIDWSRGCASRLRAYQERYRDAADICLHSSMRTPELAWHAAYCLHKLGENESAIEWAHRAAELAERQRETERCGFSNKFAWYEGPFDVMRWAYRALGDEAKEAEALAMVEKMSELRAAA